MTSETILVLGVGNTLLTDEGIGVHAVEYLRRHYRFPENVLLMDGGTLGMRLMEALMDCRLAVVLDAVLGDASPGGIYRLAGEDMRNSMSFKDSMHQADLPDTLACCELAGRRPETVVLGMQPLDYASIGVELTPVCAKALPDFCRAVAEELRARGCAVLERIDFEN